MDFSEEQKRIIEAELNNNLVSASAGSGKTTVLTARIGSEVIKGDLSVDRILVATFTEDAAANMADKIERKLKELKKQAVADHDEELASRLSVQIDLLPNAYIQTMHGFCSRVIKEKGYLIENGPMAEFTDPSCRIISDSEQDVLLQSATEYAIQDMYKSCSSEDDPFVRFTRRFGDGRSDVSLVDIVTKTYKTLRSLPDYVDVCEAFVRDREEWDSKGKIRCLQGNEYIADIIREYLVWVRDSIESDEFEENLAYRDGYQIVEELSNAEFRAKAVAVIDQALKDAEQHSVEDFFGCIAPVKELNVLTYSRMFRGLDLAGDDKALACIISFRHFINPGCLDGVNYENPYDLPDEYSEMIGFTREQILSNQKAGTEAVRSFVELLKRTDSIYSELKSMMHGMDFSDLEHTAYEILKTEEASAFYREKFKEIFVDEYQDNTRLQDKIIETFENPEGNVFRVGDIKQSIYKFRFADPKIFGSRLEEISSGKQKGNVHYLKENHRSTCEILQFANYICEQIMSRDASEIEYDKDQHLSRAQETKHGPVPRIIIADKSKPKEIETKSDLSGLEGEDDGTRRSNKALFVAVESEVRRYLEECTRVDGSKTEFKDICILTSSNNQAERVARYLNSCALSDGRMIEASGRFTTDVFEDLDIHRLINFLICLGNAYRDEYLAGVMLSNYRFSNFRVDELAKIQAFIHELRINKASLEKEPLMLRLRMFIEKSNDELAVRVKDFVDTFDRIRMSSMVMDIDDIIELVYRETGIKATLEEREGDSSKFDVFKDWLSANFKRRGSDLSGIANDLEQMKIKIKEADIEVTDANKNKISVMTVHKSKGLEFPFVILAAMGGSDEKKDTLESIMFDRDEGFITEDYDSEAITRRHSFEQIFHKMKIKLASNAETCRLLYVALTRAEESLTIVTCCDFGKQAQKSSVRSAFVHSVSYGKTAFDKRHWLVGDMKLPYCLMSALARSEDGELIRDTVGTDLKPSNVIPFYGFDGGVVKGFEVIALPADNILELYKAHSVEIKHEDTSTKERPQFDEEGKIVFPEYKYQESIDIPFKVSVTGISDGEKPFDATHVDMQIRSIDDFDSPNASILTSAAKGTILHRIMRFIDLKGLREGTVSFEDEIEDLIKEGYLNICTDDDARKVADIFRTGIIAFCKDPKCEDVIRSFDEGTARSEKPIVFAVYIHGEEGDSALVQGIIDLIYKTDEGYTILDYKTDVLSADTPEERAETALSRHAFQLNSYAAACEKDGLKIAHKLIYLVRFGEFVEV